MSQHRYLYCWFDTEYTTLELDRAKLLQVALIVTDDSLRPIVSSAPGIPDEVRRKDGLVMVVTPPPRDEMSEHVLENYQPLLGQCDQEGRSLDDVDAILSAYMDGFEETRHANIQERPAMAGNSIYADAVLARRFLPQFVNHLNYRMFDVTTIKLEWLFHYQRKKFSKRNQADQIRKYYKGEDDILGNKHDAYFDIQASMAELAYYREGHQQHGTESPR